MFDDPAIVCSKDQLSRPRFVPTQIRFARHPGLDLVERAFVAGFSASNVGTGNVQLARQNDMTSVETCRPFLPELRQSWTSEAWPATNNATPTRYMSQTGVERWLCQSPVKTSFLATLGREKPYSRRPAMG
jgi:hypothetical protein